MSDEVVVSTDSLACNVGRLELASEPQRVLQPSAVSWADGEIREGVTGNGNPRGAASGLSLSRLRAASSSSAEVYEQVESGEGSTGA